MAEAVSDPFKAAKLGEPFTIYIDSRFEVDDVRKYFLDGTGFALHIKAKIGPSKIEEGGLICDVEAVDDPVLQGEVTCALPDFNNYVLVGYFKTPDAPSATV